MVVFVLVVFVTTTLIVINNNLINLIITIQYSNSIHGGNIELNTFNHHQFLVLLLIPSSLYKNPTLFMVVFCYI